MDADGVQPSRRVAAPIGTGRELWRKVQPGCACVSGVAGSVFSFDNSFPFGNIQPISRKNIPVREERPPWFRLHRLRCCMCNICTNGGVAGSSLHFSPNRVSIGRSLSLLHRAFAGCSDGSRRVPDSRRRVPLPRVPLVQRRTVIIFGAFIFRHRWIDISVSSGMPCRAAFNVSAHEGLLLFYEHARAEEDAVSRIKDAACKICIQSRPVSVQIADVVVMILHYFRNEGDVMNRASK